MSRSRRSRFRWRGCTPPAAHDRAERLVRWAGDEYDSASRRSLGIFQLAAIARDDPGNDALARARLQAQLRWFSLHLPCPRRFSPYRDGWRHSSYGWKRTPIAISWFKPDAADHLRRAAELAAILAGLGVPVRQLSTDRPGYVTYEDRFQVVAVPFA
jgi:hypothetical protein